VILTGEEKALIERHRAEKEAARKKWQPRPKAFISSPEDAARYLKLYDLALMHFVGSDGERQCGPECDCEHYIFEAAMELCLANPGDGRRMWDEFNARHR